MTYTQMLNRIDDYASNIEPRRVLLGAITLPLFVVGWALGVVFRVAWFVGVYLWSATAVGFRTGRGLLR